MRNIKLTYHNEDGVWWVESADLPGFSAVGNTLEDARGQAKEGLEFALGTKDFSVDDIVQSAGTRPEKLIYGFHVTNNVEAFDSSTFWRPCKDVQEFSGKTAKTVNDLARSSAIKDPNTNTSPSGELRMLVEA